MTRLNCLLISFFLITGCYQSSLTPMMMVGPAAGVAQGRVVSSAISTGINYGVKSKTGKSPMGHMLAYAEEKNPEKKKETCISFIERTRSEFCTILNKQISLTNIAVKEKTLAIVKKYPKNIKTRDITVLKKIVKSSKIEDLAKNSDIHKRR